MIHLPCAKCAAFPAIWMASLMRCSLPDWFFATPCFQTSVLFPGRLKAPLLCLCVELEWKVGVKWWCRTLNVEAMENVMCKVDCSCHARGDLPTKASKLGRFSLLTILASCTNIQKMLLYFRFHTYVLCSCILCIVSNCIFLGQAGFLITGLDVTLQKIKNDPDSVKSQVLLWMDWRPDQRLSEIEHFIVVKQQAAQVPQQILVCNIEIWSLHNKTKILLKDDAVWHSGSNLPLIGPDLINRWTWI